MKRVMLVSIVTSLLAVACGGEKVNLQLKAREMKQEQNNTTPKNPSDKAGNGTDHTYNTPEKTSLRKILPNAKATRIVNIQSEDMQTTAFCSTNVVKSQNEKEQIKLQSKSQVILRQSTKVEIPEEADKVNKETPKNFVSLVCLGNPEDLTNETNSENLTIAKLKASNTIAVLGKFSSLATNFVSTAHIGCVTDEEMAKANEALNSEDKANALDIVMSAGSKMLFETDSDDVKKYVLVTCDK